MTRSFTICRALLDPHHIRHAEAVDVGVDDSDALALAGQGDREIHGHRRLADAALAAGDGDELHPAACRQQRVASRPAPWPRTGPAPAPAAASLRRGAARRQRYRAP